MPKLSQFAYDKAMRAFKVLEASRGGRPPTPDPEPELKNIPFIAKSNIQDLVDKGVLVWTDLIELRVFIFLCHSGLYESLTPGFVSKAFELEQVLESIDNTLSTRSLKEMVEDQSAFIKIQEKHSGCLKMAANSKDSKMRLRKIIKRYDMDENEDRAKRIVDMFDTCVFQCMSRQDWMNWMDDYKLDTEKKHKTLRQGKMDSEIEKALNQSRPRSRVVRR
ncbi:hypothetical protein BZA77DRAFT_348788 [Pyronema omphalodes]|nr:hypothetical protein BZA77DRAFT_348788 [Pyronema omphalodes]